MRAPLTISEAENGYVIGVGQQIWIFPTWEAATAAICAHFGKPFRPVRDDSERSGGEVAH